GLRWDAVSGREAPVAGEYVQARSAAISPDGTALALADVRGNIHLFDAAGKRIAGLDAYRIESLRFLRNGTALCAAAGDGLAILWDVTQRKVTRSLDINTLSGAPPTQRARAVISPDGRFVAATTSPKSPLVVWEFATGKEVGRIGDIDPVDFAFSADGPRFVATDRQGNARVWQVADKLTSVAKWTADGPFAIDAMALSA